MGSFRCNATALCALSLAFQASAGLGQGPATPTAAQDSGPAPEDKIDKSDSAIIVTGTILRRTDRETPSPVSVLTAADLQRRGISTITDALQTLSANGSGTLPNSFSSNGAFAAGASAPSLRGLTTDSTLILFDGLRAAYYPLADDAVRNFVDTNTIPDAIVDRIEVLRDGASSTYGADAVAGVINIILKKQITGFQATVQDGISAHGDDGHQHVTATYGWGDLASRGINVYVSAEYEHDSALAAASRGFPYNTSDYSRLVGRDADGNIVHGQNNNPNGLGPNGFNLVSVPIAEVAPADASGNQIAGTFYEPIAGSCGPYITHHAVDLDDGVDTVCEANFTHDYNDIEPRLQRFGATVHVTADLGSHAQAYGVFTYFQSRSSGSGTPQSIGNATDDGYSTFDITLPAMLTAGPNAGKLNPNDPFAAAGEDALIHYRVGDVASGGIDLNRTYRGAAGIKGSFGSGWTYSADVAGMKPDLTETRLGAVYIAGLLSVIADGSYNFVDPSQNSQAVRDRIAPTLISHAASSLYQGQVNITKTLFRLPGGDVALGVGAAIRYEGVDDPSANPQPVGDLTQQYFNVSRFGAIGHRYVESAFFELDAPILKQLDIDGSGRFDHYSAGFSHFSPKIGIKITPIRQIAFRATYSRGFRVPSFAETAQLPTVYGGDYIPSADSYFVSQHLAASGKPDAYAQDAPLANIIAGNRDLKPETSTNITAAFVAEPFRWLSLTADYYRISKDHVIVAADDTIALQDYYNGLPLPPGFTVVLDQPDAAHPNAIRRLLSIEDSFVNAKSLSTSGIDIEAQINVPFGRGIKWSSRAEATYLLKFNEVTSDGTTLHFAGTLGPIGIAAASGSPRWRGNWQNTLDFGRFEATATAYYTSGYRTTSEDYSGPGTRNDCSAISAGFYGDGTTPILCRVRHFIDVDLNLAYRIADGLTLYANVKNLTGARAPFDPVTYGGNGYNPSWAEDGVVGRYFEVGAKVTF